MVFCTQFSCRAVVRRAEAQAVCTVWRVLLKQLLEQHPSHSTHNLCLGSPDHSPATKLGAENRKLQNTV
jgi:hypothetical protein